MKGVPPSQAEATEPASLIGLLARGLVGAVVFVVLWALLNFGFGSALDGPIGAFVMEPPCHRLAQTSEPLERYSLGKGPRSSSVCHFASGPVHVLGATDGLGFTGRELLYLVIGFAGYAVCFAAAIASTVVLIRAGARLLVRVMR